ncbi:MAG: MBL fold metallo-hydrolase [Myxococcales bacterium]|nr:MBL fold metallo-hydrolase [Myxococcales bacterium]
MQAIFWGVRGSYPTPGPETVRYGGNTSCVEIASRSGERIVIDAGTGLARLGEWLAQRQLDTGRFDLLLSHMHWDHVQGLPFFAPCHQGKAQLAIHALRPDVVKLRDIVRGVARHEFFPVALDDMAASFEFHEVHPGRRFRASAFAIRPFRLNHPFGAVGYRIDGDNSSCAYVCDTAPFNLLLHKKHFLKGPEPLSTTDRRQLQNLRASLVQAVQGCDTVIYDTHYTQDEYARFPHYGHSTPDHALDLLHGQGVRRLVLFHHAPNHTDAMMDEIDAQYRHKGEQLGIEVVTAREGLALPIGNAASSGPMHLVAVP